MSDAAGDPSLTVRIDVWLWAARFFKTRRLSHEAISGGKVEVNGAACKPARMVRVADKLRVTRGTECMEVDVLALSAKRGPADAAQALYRETDASRVAREAAREQERLSGSRFDHPPNRPDKRARRQLRQLKDVR